MLSPHRRTRSLGLALGIAAITLAAAPSAHALTNPAKNPAPVTVTIDGQTYSDGKDTLPGYDDEACTPIPNVQYDFGSNEIQYYDSDGTLLKTVRWTEWSRISSYQTWVAQQQKPSTPSPGSSSGGGTATTPTGSSGGGSSSSGGSSSGGGAAAAPAATASTTPAAPSSSKTTSTKKTSSNTTKKTSTTAKKPTSTSKTTSTKKASGGSSTATTAAAAPTAGNQPAPKTTQAPTVRTGAGTKTDRAPATTTDVDATTTAEAPTQEPAAGGDDAVVAPVAGSDGQGPGSSAPADPGAQEYELASAEGPAADTRPVGIGILAALFAVAGLVFLFGLGRRSSLRPTP